MQEFNRIKSFRVGAGVSQSQMAKALGMTIPTYKSREDGSSDWKLSEMNKFVEVVNENTGRTYSVKDIFF